MTPTAARICAGAAAGLALSAAAPATSFAVQAAERRAAELYHLAREARFQGDDPQAARWLEEATLLDEDAVLPRLEWADVLLALGRPEDVPAALDPIAARVEARADSAPGQAASWWRLQAASKLRTGDREEATRLYERATRHAPWDWGLRAQLVGLHRLAGNPVAEAQHLSVLAAMAPESPEVRYELGRALLALERWREAEDAFRSAIALGGSAQVWESLGDLLLATGRSGQAVTAYERASALPGASEELPAKLERARAAPR